jgi:peptide/nickel transport system permease protein
VARFLAKRVLLALLQIFVVTMLVFSLIHIMPGDPVVLALGAENATDPVAVSEMRHKLGLDKPIITQYATWIFGFTKLDLGKSIIDESSVMSNISQRLPRTLELAIVSIFIASLIGVLTGSISALKRNTVIDKFFTSVATLGISLPVYVLGALMIILFSLQLKLFPAGGYIDFTEDPARHIARLILPSLTIALGVAASIARMTRSSMLEVLDKEYIKSLRAKGLPEVHVIFKHVLRNALIPIVTIIGLQFGNLIGGTVLIEYLFNWPGLSTLLVQSISYRDYPLIEGCILIISLFYIFLNLVVDIFYGILDPRTR